MRRTVNILAVILAVALGAWYAWRGVHQRLDAQRIASVSDEVRRLRRMIAYHAGVADADINEFGWPTDVDPAWFDDDPPINTLLPRDHPWLEIASREDGALQHPPRIIALRITDAGFWYNPLRGIVRARVPAGISDQSALKMYNAINHTSATSIFHDAPEPAKASPKPDEAQRSRSKSIVRVWHAPDAP